MLSFCSRFAIGYWLLAIGYLPMSFPRRCLTVPWLCLLLSTASSVAAADAISDLKSIAEKLRLARANHDWSAAVAEADEQNRLLNGAPNALLEVASVKAESGDLAGAISDLEQFVRMGQSTDLLARSPQFALLRQKSEFAAIEAGMKENRSAITLATTVCPLPDPALLPEDFDYDPGTKRFFITTVRGKEIISADFDGTIHEFAKAPDDWPLLAIKIDPERGWLWATEVALKGFVFVPESAWERSALLCYDLKTGKLIYRIEGPTGSALGDMALTPNGDVIVSDGDGGGVYEVEAGGEQLKRLDSGEFISPQTPAA